jgi:hypothetical protein
MPKFNADEQVFEPIELTLNGKTYKVESVDQAMFARIEEVSKGAADRADLDVVARQLGVILGAEPAEFKGVDLRKLSAALKFLTKAITSQIEGKEGNG